MDAREHARLTTRRVDQNHLRIEKVETVEPTSIDVGDADRTPVRAKLLSQTVAEHGIVGDEKDAGVAEETLRRGHEGAGRQRKPHWVYFPHLKDVCLIPAREARQLTETMVSSHHADVITRSLCLFALLCLACGDDASSDAGVDVGVDAAGDAAGDATDARLPVRAKLDFGDGAGFFDAPFPIETRRRENGSLRVADVPDRGNGLVGQLLDLLEEGTEGFATNAAIFVPFDGPLDPTSLPDLAGSLEDDASVFLIDLETGTRIPIEVEQSFGDTYTADHTLVALPFPGAVLRPQALHALVVTDAVQSESGLERADALIDLSEGVVPPGAELAADAFAELFAWVDSSSLSREQVVAATVFTTGDPFSRLRRARDDAAAADPGAIADVVLLEEFDDYCAIGATMQMPIYQRGPMPYREPPSGRLVTDATGALELQESQPIELVLTLPKTEMPTEGYPLVLYAAGSGGVARQVIDRTEIAMGETTGLGPALHYARQGIAAAGFAAPLSGDRSPDESDGTLHFWNFQNLGAFRGNLEQAALDITSVINTLEDLRIDATLCPGGTGRARYDTSHLYLQGHSTGGSIASIAIALEPRLRGAVISGSGGSWIYNVAQSTVELGEGVLLRLAVFAATQLGRVADDPTRFDIDLSLFQTTLASFEVMSWGRVTALETEAPRDVLFIGGVIDTFHEPRLINSQGMSLGATMALPTAEPTWESEFALVGLDGADPPLSANVNGSTVVMMQREETRDDVNGHYVPFEHDDVKQRFACFIASDVRDGTPTLYGATVDTDCN